MDTKQAYNILSDLIFKGFLVTEVSFDDFKFVLKTVNEKEFSLIKMYAGNPEKKDYQLKFDVYFLIFSLLVINNQNLLCDRTKNIPDLYNFVLSLPEALIKKMLSSLMLLRTSAFEAIKSIEGFSYTNFARNYWNVLNGAIPSKTEFTGIPGTTEIGLNVHQESWIIINKALDLEEDYNKDFSLSLLVASAYNPKGSKEIRGKFDSSKKMAEDRRIKLAQQGFIDTRKWSPEGWSASVDTTEELVAELERQMSGVKDKHDIFMEKYMNNLREQAEKKTREAEERISKYRQNPDNVFIDGEQRSLTDAEVKAMFSKKVLYTQTVKEDDVTDEDKNKFYKKLGNRVLTAK